ncbi:MAG TPA: ABC transporter permease [Candidatus Moranbacteria bacterium]|nr:ABC transporter permease [Candidatus Moranbacteria bacterium]
MHEVIVSIKLAIKNLKSNLGRTLLSLLGIVIGVASVILVLSFGSGVKNYLVDQVSSFGTDIMQIEVKVPKVNKMSSANATGQVGGVNITTLKLDDAKRVAKLDNIDSWYAMVISQQITSFENKKKQAMMIGVTAGVIKADPKTEIDKGRMFTEEEDSSLAQVAVLGSEIRKYYFGDSDPVGQAIKIKGQSYKVIGVLKSRGTTGVFSFDDTVYLPLQTVQKKLAGIDYIQTVIFKLKNMDKLDLTIAQATDIMRTQHHISSNNSDDDDFAVNTIVELLDILDKVFFAVNALLLALTSVSLVVGGVGIMNVMYVAVSERTYEIGLKKSVGAKNFDILAQFLFEAMILTFMGGVIGIAIGILVTRGGEIVAGSIGYPLNLSITAWSIALGFGFSAFTGIVFGYWPARNASKMSPMEALRKE